MKVIVMSDLHGHLPKIDEGFDLMLLPGDVCPVWNHNRKYQLEWLMNDFVEWVNGLHFYDKFSQVILCAGNHDLCLEGISKKKIEKLEEATNYRLKYIENEEYTFDIIEGEEFCSYRIYATPICKVFGNWAFMREDLDKYYKNIPEGLDILITHDAPDINNLGLIHQGHYRGTNAGNTVLAQYVNRVKPRFAFCGHIHSGNHNFSKNGDTWVRNVSIMDEEYNPTYEPFIVQITK